HTLDRAPRLSVRGDTQGFPAVAYGCSTGVSQTCYCELKRAREARIETFQNSKGARLAIETVHRGRNPFRHSAARSSAKSAKGSSAASSATGSRSRSFGRAKE